MTGTKRGADKREKILALAKLHGWVLGSEAQSMMGDGTTKPVSDLINMKSQGTVVHTWIDIFMRHTGSAKTAEFLDLVWARTPWDDFRFLYGAYRGGNFSDPDALHEVPTLDGRRYYAVHRVLAGDHTYMTREQERIETNDRRIAHARKTS